MQAPLGEELAALSGMDLAALRQKWRSLYRSLPPPRLSRDLLARVIAYKLQEAVHGGLTLAVRRKLAAVAKAPTSQDPAPLLRLKPGAALLREWQGVTHQVRVLEEGFEYRGQRYRSLSQIAQVITGAHWSGPRFFGLGRPPARKRTG